jgi:parallel beta-helix repeat protein
LGSSSNNNSISGNNFTASSSCGISLYSSSNTSISGNTFTDDGLAIFYSYQNFVEGNTVNGKPLVYLEDISDYSVSDAGQVILVNCDSIRVEGLNLSKASRGVQLLNTTNSIIARNTIANNYNGVWLDSSLNNSISGNNITASNFYDIRLSSSLNNSISGNNITAGNFYGISLDSSLNNSISGNNIADNEYGISLAFSSNNSVSGNSIANNEYGISIYSSSDNNVYHNNFVENTLQVHSAGSINVWDDGYPSGGNYWSDYNGADVNRDGIGDTPYIIDGNNRDNHPLMTPYVPSEYLQFLCMRFLYYDLLGKYNELLKSIVGPNSTFNELSSNYGSLLVSFNGLNASYQQHLLNFSTLEANYTKLREDFDSLNTDYVSLDSSYQALNSSYNSLNASFNEYKASTQSELAYAKNLEYALTAITVILLVAIVYVVLRKPQTKSETQRPLQSTEEK